VVQCTHCAVTPVHPGTEAVEAAGGLPIIVNGVEPPETRIPAASHPEGGVPVRPAYGAPSHPGVHELQFKNVTSFSGTVEPPPATVKTFDVNDG